MLPLLNCELSEAGSCLFHFILCGLMESGTIQVFNTFIVLNCNKRMGDKMLQYDFTPALAFSRKNAKI